MKRWFARYKQCLALSKWPVLTPAELKDNERRLSIKRLYKNDVFNKK
jgi:hypothetical protein